MPQPSAPDGFVCCASMGGIRLIADERHVDSLVGAGLDRIDGWQRELAGGRRGAVTGRGRSAVVKLESGPTVRLKQLARGGWAGSFWRGRFLGCRRIVDNLRLPLAVAARAIPTAEPMALLLASGPPGLYRGWLATSEIAARDLGSLLRAGRFDQAVRAALAVVREMHDRGVVHPDLNVGNLLCDAESGDAWIIDLDRVRLLPGAVPFYLRQRALRRLERSVAKAGGDAADREALYPAYAARDEALAERLGRGRWLGRWLTALHRVGWRGSAP